MSYKHLFQRALAAAPDRLHFAAHSHSLWPDASWLGHQAAWEDAARLADHKWGRVMGEIYPAAQAEVAAELRLPDPATIVFAGNTHDLLLRIVSARSEHPVRILTSDGEFHSFRRQSQRWLESGRVALDIVPAGEGFADRFLAAARAGSHDLIFVSQVMFETGAVFTALADLAALARPDGPWVAIDGYHGFMAIENDLSAVADRIFYVAGGYKYAMAGEGAAFLHCPPGFGPRPEITGWYAEFADLEKAPGKIGYSADAMRFMGSTFDPSGLYRLVAVRDMLAAEVKIHRRHHKQREQRTNGHAGGDHQTHGETGSSAGAGREQQRQHAQHQRSGQQEVAAGGHHPEKQRVYAQLIAAGKQ